MASEADAVYIRLEARTAAAEKALDRFKKSATKDMTDVQKVAVDTRRKLEASLGGINVGGAGAGILRDLRGLKAGIAGLVGGASIAALTQFMDQLGKIADVADTAGLTTKAVQQITHAIEQAGGTAEDASNGILKFVKNLALARQGKGPLAADFAANNVVVTDDVLEMIEKVVGLIARAKNEQDALLLAERSFGRASADSWALAAKSVEEFNRARRAAAVIDDAVVRQGADLGDRFATAAAEIRSNLAPAMTDLMGQLTAASERLAKMSGLFKELYELGRANVPAQMSIGEKMVAAYELRIKDEQATLAKLREQYAREVAEGANTFTGSAETFIGNQIKVIEARIAEFQKMRDSYLAATEATPPPPPPGPRTVRGGVPFNPGPWQPTVVTDGTGGTGTGSGSIKAATADMDQFAHAAAAAKARVDELKAAVDRMAQANLQASEYANDFAQGFLVEGQSIRESLAAVLKQMQSDLLRFVITGQGPMKAFFDALNGAAAGGTTTGGGGIFGFLGQLLAGAGGGAGAGVGGGINANALQFGGPRAGGGPVSPDRAFLVGERGPELFIPDGHGLVMPHDQTAAFAGGMQASRGRSGGGDGGGRPVNVTVNVTTPDVEGFRRGQQQVASSIARAVARGQRGL